MEKTIYLPDVGDLEGVEVVEIFVKAGDSIDKEQTILSLEGSKASMEIPATDSGVIKEVLVNVGDSATESMALATLTQSNQSSATENVENTEKSEQTQVKETKEIKESSKVQNDSSQSNESVQNQPSNNQSQSVTFTLPDVGDLDEVEVVEVFVKVGDSVAKEQTIITLEGSKASMEIPSSYDGVIESILVKVGDTATDAMPIAIIKTMQGSTNNEKNNDKIEKPIKPETAGSSSSSPSPAHSDLANQSNLTDKADTTLEQSPSSIGSTNSSNSAHASPSVRKFARVLGVNLAEVQGSGLKNRISKEDVEKFIKAKMQSASNSANNQASTGSGIPTIAKVDFEKFGAVEYKKLNKIKLISSNHLHASWLNIPHVTQYADINAETLENYRQAKKTAIEKQGYKLTPLILIMKAIVASLKEFPNFNSSLVDSQIAVKKYYNIGIAVDTEDGLVVPVIRNVDEKSIFALAKELSEISEKARAKKLNVTDMTGGTFTISNLGGLGAEKFTPIINAPEVAILGLSRSYIKPVFSSGYFMPQLTMPLSLSYDHRVIDGAEGARFMNSLASNFLDIASLV